MSAPWTEERPRDDTGWVDVELTPGEDRQPVHSPDGLVTLRYLWDAIRRHARLWLVTAAVGLVTGLAFPFVLPPPVEATTKLLLTHRSGDDPAQAIATDVRLATTDTVARRVVDELGLEEPANELLKRYTVEATTDRIVLITVTAPTGEEALRLASTIASTFLEFRMEQVLAQQKPLERDLARLQAKSTNLEHKVTKNGGSVDDVPKTKAAVELERVNSELEQMTQKVREQDASAALASSSRTLDPAVVEDRSAVRTVGLDTVTGLVGGLVLGCGFIVARALLSDRLWRRQAVAEALGAPVAASLDQVPVHWWQRPWQARGERVVRTAVDKLRECVHWTTTTTPTLVVVAVDSLRESAVLVAELAESYLREGRSVLVADLSATGVLAERLGVDEKGTVVDGPLAVYVPDSDAGPAEGGLRRRRAEQSNPLLAAWDAADVVLTLTELHPARGGDHLSTWSSHAVAVVTAGRSTATRIHTTGEMVRQAGMWLAGAVLLRQDRTDETIGQPPDTATSAMPVGVVER